MDPYKEYIRSLSDEEFLKEFNKIKKEMERRRKKKIKEQLKGKNKTNVTVLEKKTKPKK